MPRLLFVNRHYAPELAPTGQCLADLAESLVARGYEVEVLSGPPLGPMYAPPTEVRNGVRVRRVPTASLGLPGSLGRVLDYAGFFVQALWRLLAGREYDLAVVLTTPPLLSVAAAAAHRLRGRRYAIWSMDLHPEAEAAAGMVEDGGLVARALGSLADEGYRHADFVVALGETMRERLLARGVPADTLHTIGVWSDGRRVAPIKAWQSRLRRRLGVGGRLVVMYAGNAGLAHRFDEVVEAMRLLCDDDRFFFLFVGGGAQRAVIERAIAERGGGVYLDHVPSDALSDALGAGDVHLVTLHEEMAGVAVPSKLYGIMAAGRPTVFVGPVRSEVARTLTEARAGVVIDPSSGEGAERLVATLRDLADDEAARRAMGERARAAFLTEHDRPIPCERWARLLGRTVGGPPPASRGGQEAAVRAAPARGATV